LDLSAGAPPDLYFAGGQRWGMPAYNWPAMARGDYDYLERKLRYAENFYDMYRIDHVIGVFRLYTIPVDSPPERGGLDGRLNRKTNERGNNTVGVCWKSCWTARACFPAGKIWAWCPPVRIRCFGNSLSRASRFNAGRRIGGKPMALMPPNTYRPNAVAVCSTHDMSIVAAWWKYEVATVDDFFFKIKCQDIKSPTMT
jgi:4-alpha-glucanotransferase